MQRTVVCMYDGFGYEYFDKNLLPTMKHMASEGMLKQGRALFPTLTNANNISIICGAPPAIHGVTTNCYFDEVSETAQFLEDPKTILSPTVFHHFRERGTGSALLTCKAKTLLLVGSDADIAVAAESPSQEVIDRYGAPPPMYSSEVNYWLWEIALDILANRPDIGLVYVHTTDYPMHMWAPEEPQSIEHMSRLDELLEKASTIAPDALFLITADHGMNSKKLCIDLRKTCAENGIDLRFCISPVADRLLKHHRGFGGVSYVYLHSDNDILKVTEFLLGLEGVDEVIPRREAASCFNLLAERIGDLVVLADKFTVFGDLEESKELLAADYRNHGSMYENDIPLIIYGYQGELPSPDSFEMNYDLTRWLINTILTGERR
ncbi:MAG: alkaline phosphatase family protein [Deltaproteobacteria bacterium]